MLISKAYAQVDVEIGETVAPVAPSQGEAFAMNMGMVLVLVVLFYFLMIRPQQKRFKEHSQMLAGLKKGDRVVTSGGLVGVIEQITEGSDEVTVNLGNGTKVTAVLQTLSKKEAPEGQAAANDEPKKASGTKKKKSASSSTKKPAAKKAAQKTVKKTAKKTAGKKKAAKK